jgi:hypothetical protein
LPEQHLSIVCVFHDLIKVVVSLRENRCFETALDGLAVSWHISDLPTLFSITAASCERWLDMQMCSFRYKKQEIDGQQYAKGISQIDIMFGQRPLVRSFVLWM